MRFLFQMFWSFFKIGAFTFGGGYAMVPLIQKEVVDARRWVTDEEFIDMLGLAQTAPGPVAVNTSVFVGYKKARYVGAIAAVIGATLPSFLVILAVAALFAEIRHLPAAEAAFSGVRPAVVALVAGAAYKIGRTAIRDVRGIVIGAVALVAIAVFDVHPIPVIVGSAIVGYLLYRKDIQAEPQAVRARTAGPRTEVGGSGPSDQVSGDTDGIAHAAPGAADPPDAAGDGKVASAE
ncbi:MAG: chromate transporter [Bacillota bacterium]|nr:chromate transporter [Bacillota bacterium]